MGKTYTKLTDEDVDAIYRQSRRRISGVTTSFHRYLYEKINWNDTLICIKGARGVGKTTLILQHIKETFSADEKALYVSLDNLWFLSHSLEELIEYHYLHGGTHLFLDEVHHYPHWQTLLKNIADEYISMHVVYTGSSMLEIDANEGDLSRRQIVYQMFGMSFREYLTFEGVTNIPALTLPELLESHVEIADDIATNIRILPYFGQYLQSGYYPFYKSTFEGYDLRLQAVVKQVIESDLPCVQDIQYPTVVKIKKMLVILAERVPQTPNMSELYGELETNREQGLKMLHTLQRAGLLGLLSAEAKKIRQLSRPDKIYLDNTNLMYALTTHVDKGTLRETFFRNQLAQAHSLLLPQKGDFIVDSKYLFEIGGAHKTFNQISDMPNSYLGIDDIDVGRKSRIPLWMFGLLY